MIRHDGQINAKFIAFPRSLYISYSHFSDN